MVGDGDAGELVREFLRKHGLRESELALEEDIKEREAAEGGGERVEVEVGSYFDFEKFLFVLPPVRIPAAGGASSRREGGGDGLVVGPEGYSGSVSEDEFVSLRSSTSGCCSSEFVNPYGLRSSSQPDSETSSDRLSQFGTARDYPQFDMQNDIQWYDDRDEGQFMTPCFSGQDYFGCQSEDKFIMNSKCGNESESAFGLFDKSDGLETDLNADYLDKPCLFDTESMRNKIRPATLDYDLFDKGNQLQGGMEGKKIDYLHPSSKEADLDMYHLQLEFVPTDRDMAANYSSKDLYGNCFVEELKPVMGSSKENEDVEKNQEDGDVGELETGTEHKGVNADELPIDDFQKEGFEVFNLRIIHRKNRTGFEESKELPVVLNSVIAGRYYVTEYLGSAAFSKVIQAHDLHTGMDVCLKIIKNDKDFFDQSLDEIKLLKLVNMHDPADERHILRLYDYFYLQEHLFIVCELLKANLYEFQKFNQESGGEVYFTPSRLQVITRQCLEALEYLHHLGIMHCDLKPENILIKSYRRCEIKVIDLGSSCFRSDTLCLYVQSRSYRAPEVILGLQYDEKIDIWSLGCILAELCSGEVLFPNNAVVMILAQVIGMFGPIDMEMLVGGQETSKYFSEEYDLYHINEETDQLEYIIPEESTLEDHLQTSDAGFIEFVRYLLEVNPSRRPTAQEALEHPWLSYPYAS